MTTPARIIFAGSPDFAVPCLAALVDAGYDVPLVLSQPDRPAGRGRKLTPCPVRAAALELGLETLQPTTLKDAAVQKALAEAKPDLMVVVAFGQLLPPAVLNLPSRGCINVHASLLPRWRGASPIQAAILAGDERSGVCIMGMEEGLDTGPVYAAAAIDIGGAETASELHDRLSRLGADTLMAALPGILAGQVEPEPQPGDGVTYAGKISKADAVMDWKQPAVELHRRVCAFNSWPVAETTLAGSQLRCWRSELPGITSDAAPGSIIGVDHGLDVATGEGVLRITEIQRPGKKRQAVTALSNRHDWLGEVLG